MLFDIHHSYHTYTSYSSYVSEIVLLAKSLLSEYAVS